MKDRKKKDEDKTILIIWSADSHWVHHDIPGGSDGYKFLDGHAGAAGVLRLSLIHILMGKIVPMMRFLNVEESGIFTGLWSVFWRKRS